MIDKSTTEYQYTGTLCDEYIYASAKVDEVERKVANLREKGNYRIMGKVVHDEWRKAAIKRNNALRKLQAHLDLVASRETE